MPYRKRLTACGLKKYSIPYEAQTVYPKSKFQTSNAFVPVRSKSSPTEFMVISGHINTVTRSCMQQKRT